VKRKFKITLAIDNRIIEIQEEIETSPNFKAGEANSMAHLFYRAMLANGFSPAIACGSLGRIAVAGGYVHGDDEQQAGLDFEAGSEG